MTDAFSQLSRKMQFFQALEQLQSIQKAFDDAGIDWVLVKGVGVALAAWPDPFARSFSDLDIFVRPRHFGQAVVELLRIGYTQERSGEDLSMHWVLRPERGFSVELHHDFTREWTTPRDLLDRFLDAPHLVDAGSFHLKLPSPAQHLAFVLLHAANHGWQLDENWLYDVEYLEARFPGSLAAALDVFPARWPVALAVALAAAQNPRIPADAIPKASRRTGRVLAKFLQNARSDKSRQLLSAILRVAGSPHPVETLCRMAARFQPGVSPLARVFRIH